MHKLGLWHGGSVPTSVMLEMSGFNEVRRKEKKIFEEKQSGFAVVIILFTHTAVGSARP